MSEEVPNYRNSDDLQRYFQSQEGVATSILKEFEETYKVPKKEMASLLGVSEKTYYNLLAEDTLDFNRSDRFLQVHKVFEEGIHTLNSATNFLDWLHTPQVIFNNQKPFDLMGSISGLEAVYEELGRIKHGILA